MILYRLLSYLPFPLLYALAWLVYLALYYVVRYRRPVVRDNLKGAFPDRSDAELTVLAKNFYRQLAQVALEIVKARRMRRKDFLERVRVINPELLREYSNDFQESVILVAIHQGNWEWLLHGTTLVLGKPLDPIYKPLHIKTADRLVFEVRSRFGSRPLALADSAKDILRHRRQFRILVMLADQSPTPKERSVWTTFMNREAAFHPGPESLSRLTGFPVIFAQCRRRSRGYYELEFHPLARPPYTGDDHAITERYVRMAERAICEQPESWLWSNRRWKRDRASEEAAAKDGAS
jgi:KDO2-lipid IV(A) lauroyltransferase